MSENAIDHSTVQAVPNGSDSTASSGATHLHRKLTSSGVLILTLSCLSPVFSICGVGGDVLQHAGTGAAGLFLFGIAASIVWAVVYAELGSAYPYAGADYVGVGSILGPWAGFATLVAWAVTVGPAVALEGKVIGAYVGELSPACSPEIVSIFAVALAVAGALLAVRAGTLLISLFLLIEMVTVTLLVWGGFSHPARSILSVLAHPIIFDSQGALGDVPIAALALGAVSSAYATVGGNQAIGFGEELKQPHRNMGKVVLLAGIIGAVSIALPVVAVTVGATNLQAVLGSPAPFSAFVTEISGPAAARILSASVSLAIFNALIAQVMFSARLYFSIGRDAIFPPPISRALASVHASSGVPRCATVVVGIFSVGCCLMKTHVLIVFLQGLVAYSLALVSLAVWVGRRKGLTGESGCWRSPLFPLGPLAGLGLAAAFCISDLLDPVAGRPGILVLGTMICCAIAWCRLVLERRPGGWSPRLE